MPIPISLLRSLFLFSLFCTASAQGLTGAQINIVKQQLQEGATHSWERGTRAEALLELSVPSFSVLSPSFRLYPSVNASVNASLTDVYTIARNAVAALPSPPSNGTGQPLFLGDSSAGDPASIGVAVLIANWTGLRDEDYAGAATAQLEYLFGPEVPKTSDGAISHRTEQIQLWSDSVFMVPPFLAFYGLTTGNQSMLQEAYTQIKLYRNYLFDSSANGLWRHVVLGANGTDPGHWSTGNAWAAAGMLRVLGSLNHSAYAKSFQSEISDLSSWVSEIHSGMYPYLQSNGLFKNYVDGLYTNATNSSSSIGNFDDASGSALLAATVYHLALLTGNKTFIPKAELTRSALFATNGTSATPFTTVTTIYPSSSSSSSSSSNSSYYSSYYSSYSSSSASPTPMAASASSPFANTPYFTSDGWLSPVVNPENYVFEGSESPESEAFVLMLYAAWRDWKAKNGSGSAQKSSASLRLAIVWNNCWSGTCGGAGSMLLAVFAVVMACTLGDLFI